MSQTNGNLGIAALIGPLSRTNLGRAFARGTSIFSFTRKQKRSARIWDMIFKDESWFRALEGIECHHHPLNPTLVGCDLGKLYYSSSTSAYIALLISDWSGDCQYLNQSFFASLREHDYDKQAFEVRFKNSNIILNVRDAVTGDDWIEMEDPRRLFRCHNQNLKTAVLYFKDENLFKIGPDKIGMVIDMPIKKKKCIENICSLRLQFGNDMPVYRVIQKSNMSIRLVNIMKKDEYGAEWVTSWRLARVGEKEWWPR